ncbi:flagellar hook-associated protein FlgK [Desulfosporosinus orientis DSM 765]|uniref:Flagellar hook-associated protein 1 n=1 Tax=Desulfosporosinus orientis (strain ATCC 19365 / DSM 765 / NCIMB 8382 / VKM B-1628 / Singapore I) TaxID=768706 RepID=G7WIV3_DESOD|nr:flagellar hook-associated protein FlgK [Desulfosporosinus orientis]AET69678.1 flagellar hook-associated protein FlgK [Desulfosporosinus orientis DSM 765]
MSSFLGLSIAASGLSASQRALNTVGHNISNVDTEGYVRQQVVQVEQSYLKNGQYQIGRGTSVQTVRQIRSIFLDNMYREEQSTLSYWQTKASVIEDVEAAMNDLSDDEGIQTALSDYFAAWQELANDPTSDTARASLLGYGDSLTAMFNLIDEQLDQIQENLDTQIQSMTTDINTIAGQIAELNQQIVRAESNGDNANDYRDQLNSLLDTLSECVDTKVSINSKGMYNVSIGGVSLVNGTQVNQLACQTNSSDGTTTVVWKDTQQVLKLKDGMLLGLIEARGEDSSVLESGTTEADVDADAANDNFSGDSSNLISDIRTGLNILVNLMARKINSIHSSGEGLDGSTGTDFFVKIDENLPFGIGNIQVNPVLQNTDRIAASSIGGSNDGAIASEIMDFADSDYFTFDGLTMNISDYYAELVGWIGTQGEEADANVSNQEALVEQIQSSWESYSSVSMDEELTNLLKYQHAYNASARVMSTIDSMLETLIQQMA